MLTLPTKIQDGGPTTILKSNRDVYNSTSFRDIFTKFEMCIDTSLSQLSVTLPAKIRDGGRPPFFHNMMFWFHCCCMLILIVFIGNQGGSSRCPNCGIPNDHGGICADCLHLPYCRLCKRHLPTHCFDQPHNHICQVITSILRDYFFYSLSHIHLFRCTYRTLSNSLIVLF